MLCVRVHTCVRVRLFGCGYVPVMSEDVLRGE